MTARERLKAHMDAGGIVYAPAMVMDALEEAEQAATALEADVRALSEKWKQLDMPGPAAALDSLLARHAKPRLERTH